MGVHTGTRSAAACGANLEARSLALRLELGGATHGLARLALGLLLGALGVLQRAGQRRHRRCGLVL